ncbi:phage tail protein I [Marivivens aquimaris]|uniref:phage tail protein I n=1 Tax=Marivivens aquimaris TaxID=2774876 RepID=UPI00187EF5C9|nr:phage tail protein I [Marivivens aquimaris]
MTEPILPTSIGPVARVIERAIVAHLASTTVLTTLYDPQKAPAEVLPWLGWAIGIDWWSSDWSESERRDVIERATLIHRRKGTPWAIREAMRVMGFPKVRIFEDYSLNLYDGGTARDGSSNRAGVDHWADYRITVQTTVTIARAEHIRRVLASIAPARCRLRELNFTAAAHIYNGTLARNGTYSRGVA